MSESRGKPRRGRSILGVLGVPIIAGLSGGAVLLAALVLDGQIALPGPSGRPTSGPVGQATPGPTDPAIGEVLPTPSTDDVVLLVGSKDSLTEAEQGWHADLLAQFGRVATLAYRDATAETLGAYFTIFVTDQSSDLDVGALATVYQNGRTVHLIGPAAGYGPQVVGPAPT